MKAIIAGAFDPFTLGHKDIVTRAAALYDKVVVAIAADTEKVTAPLDTRVEIAKLSLQDVRGVKIEPFSGLLTDFAEKVKADVIVRGLRNTADFEYERSLAAVYASLSGIECVYFMCSPKLSHVSSSTVRALAAVGGPLKGYVVNAAQRIVKDVYGTSNVQGAK